MHDWLNINALISICLSIPLYFVSLHLLLFLFLALILFSPSLTSLSLLPLPYRSPSSSLIIPLSFLLSVPNLNSDLFDLQPAFIPAVQSTPSISTANSAWGGMLPTNTHTQRNLHKHTPAFTHTVYEQQGRRHANKTDTYLRAHTQIKMYKMNLCLSKKCVWHSGDVFPLASHSHVCPSICRAIHLSFYVNHPPTIIPSFSS